MSEHSHEDRDADEPETPDGTDVKTPEQQAEEQTPPVSGPLDAEEDDGTGSPSGAG